MHRLAFGAAAATAVLCVGGCGWLGPTAIKNSRGNYNEVIQRTSMEQTLANIVRVHNHEPTLVFDVTEVDATTSFQGAASGGVAGIGARPGTGGGTLAGQVGSAGAALQYSDTPTIRYFPLVGQALVSQMVTPVSVDAIAQLSGSDWPTAPVFDLAMSVLTPNYEDYYVALNTIDELAAYSALQISATKSNLTGSSLDDSLILYVAPFGSLDADEKGIKLERERRILKLWIRLLRIYAPAQSLKSLGLRPGGSGDSPATLAEMRAYDAKLGTIEAEADRLTEDALMDRFWSLPNRIELRAAAVGPDRAKGELLGQNGVPILRTYSALGTLKDATQYPYQRIKFVTPAGFDAIVRQPWNRERANEFLFDYYLTSADLENAGGGNRPVDCAGRPSSSPEAPQQPAAEVTCWLERWESDQKRPGGLFSYEPSKGEDSRSAGFIARNQQLGSYRRYLLIVHGAQLPSSPAPYVAYHDDDSGEWYYIAGNDEVSQRNFVLISLFMTMMATASSAPLVPTISVGGH
jgi:hypothetical protein